MMNIEVVNIILQVARDDENELIPSLEAMESVINFQRKIIT